MKFWRVSSLFALVLALPVQAQEKVEPPKADAAAAREALIKKESDSADDAALLKSTLTAVDKQYAMLKRGKIQLTYDFNYTYVGVDRINTDLSSSAATIFSIENENSHTISNTISAEYGLRDNLTASLSIPVVSKYSKTQFIDGVSHSVGDISIGARLQPIESKPDAPTLNVNLGVRIPSGTSPYKVISGSGLATGSGTTGITAGVSVNKVSDPVAIFGSMNVTYSLPSKELNQIMNGAILTEVAPGMSFGFGLGFAYALSYSITTSISFQESISRGSVLTFSDGRSATTGISTSGTLNMGLGYRVSPKTTINTTLGIGLTANSPNMSIGISLPLAL